MEYFLGLRNEEPPRFEIVNDIAVHEHKGRIHDEYHDHEESERELALFRGMPKPIFRFGDPAFELDYFDAGMNCASQRLRRAFGLGDDVVSYRDIDLDGSPPAALAKEYQAFQAVHYADVVDWNRTPGMAFDVRRADGSIGKEWRLGSPGPNDPAVRIYWRDDFVPPAPLFRANGTPWMLVTDEVADKVMRAGITDLTFVDLTNERAQTELVYRQL
jgi:hypothetical protein